MECNPKTECKKPTFFQDAQCFWDRQQIHDQDNTLTEDRFPFKERKEGVKYDMFSFNK